MVELDLFSMILKRGFATTKTLIIILIASFVILSSVNAFIISNMGKHITSKISLAKEQSRPAEIQLTAITLSDCKECFDINSAVQDVKKQNVNVTSQDTLDYKSPGAKELIALYNIEKLPTLIIKGETNKTEQLTLYWNHIGEQRGTNYETVLYTNINLPYYGIIEEKVLGRVSLTYLVDSSCIKCVSLTGVVNAFKQDGVKFVEEKTVEYKSVEGADLVKRFGVREIPALIISKDILGYDSIKQIWTQLNTTEKEGFYALHSTIPPYVDVATDKVVGLVTLIILNDKSCNVCYDPLVNKQILARFGVATEKELSYDISSDEGKNLIIKYNITKVPIIILSPETNVYSGFTEIWPQVGTIEKDGWYVMRSPEILGTYKDLSTNQIVQPQRQGRSTHGG